MQLCIQLLNIERGQKILIEDGVFPLRCQVTLSCGCPACAGGRFDASRFKVSALLLRSGEVVSKTDMAFTGRVSEFAGSLHVDREGEFHLMLEALDEETGAAGRISMPVILTSAKNFL